MPLQTPCSRPSTCPACALPRASALLTHACSQALIYINPWGALAAPEGASISPGLIAVAPTGKAVGTVGKLVQTVGIKVPP